MKHSLQLALVTLLLAALPAQAAWTHIQGAKGRDTAGNGSATSLTITLGSTPTAGNLICVGLNLAGKTTLPTTISIKDSNSNAYQLTPDTATNGTALAAVAYLLVAPSNATKTINVSWTNGAYGVGWAEEFHSGDSAVYDKDAVKSSGTATTGTPYTINLPSITPAYSGELLYSVANPHNNITAPASGATLGGWTGAAGGIDSNYDSTAEYILSASGATAVDYTDNTSGDSYAAAAMAFYSGTYTASPSETNTASDSVTATCTGVCGGASHYAASPSETNTASDSLAASAHNFGVKYIGGAGNGGATKDETTKTASYSPTAGHAIIASAYTCGPAGTCQDSVSTTMSIGDNVNNPEPCFYPSPGSPWWLVETSSGAQKVQEYIWMCDQIPSGVTNFTITCSTASSCSFMTLTVTDWTGLASSGNPFDVDGGGASTVQGETATLTLSSSSKRTNELLYTFADNTNDETMTPVAPAMQALQFYAGNLNEFELVASTGTYSLQATWTPNDDWYGVVAAIRTAGSSGGTPYTATPSETNTASDGGVARLAAYGRTDSETNTASDGGVTRTAGFSRSDSETNTASDNTPARLATLERGETETNTASDALARAASFGRGDSETNTASDLLSALKPAGSYNAVMSEVLSLSDGLGRAAAYLRADAETNTAADGLARRGGFVRSDAEVNPSSDGLARAHGMFVAVSEIQSPGDSVSRLAAFGRGATDTNAASDALARFTALYRQAAEAEAFADVVASIWTGYLGIPVQPRHAGTVPGKSKTGQVPGRPKTGEAPVH